MRKFITWVKANKHEAVIILVIITVASLLRFYKIDQFLTFLGDEGRDAIVVKNLITKGDLIFIGPTTSIGNMYLGPAYYYMMAPFLLIWHLSPIGPAVMVAILGVATVFLTYYLGRLFFSKEVGLFASAILAVSPAMIIASKSSWNPNPMPFFALLLILSIYKLLNDRRPIWLVLTGFALAFCLQMHYLGLLLVPLTGVFWLWYLFVIRNKSNDLARFAIWSLVSLSVFMIIMSPLVIFDLNPEHKFLNLNAFKKFFLERSATGEHLATVNLNPANAFPRVIPLYVSFFGSFVTAQNVLLAKFLAVAVLIGGFLTFKKAKNKTALLILAVWLVFGIFGLSLYQLKVFDHYFGFLQPAVFLLTGILLWSIYQTNKFFKIITLVIFAFILFSNFKKSPVLATPNNQLAKTQERVGFVINEANGKPFNFALIAKNNYDSAYQYYFDIRKVKSIVIDNQNLQETIADQLFVICEDRDCQPLGFPKWEVAGFGKAKGLAILDKEIDFAGVKIYKLVHGPQKF